jgi:hypothetical protein
MHDKNISFDTWFCRYFFTLLQKKSGVKATLSYLYDKWNLENKK